MTLSKAYSFGPTSVTATAFGSTTNNAYWAWPQNALGYVAHMQVGSIVNTGHVAWTLDHAYENPSESTPTWKNLLTGTLLSATNQVAVEFESVSIRPLLPYGRLQFIAKSQDAGALAIRDIVGRILTEVY